MLILKLAVRNLRRHLRRTLLSLAGIALGTALTVFSLGLGDGAHAQMIENGVVLGQGHMAFMREGYHQAPSPGLALSGAGALAERLRADPDIRDAFPRVKGEGMLATAHGAEGVMFNGIDPGLPGEARLLRKAVRQGAFLEGGDASEVVLGEKLARRLKLKVGGKAVLTCQDAGGEITSVLVRVKGIFKSGSDAIDGAYVLLPLGTAQRMMALPGRVHAVAVYLKDPRRQEAVLARWKGEAPEGSVLLPWQTLQPDLRDYVILDDVLAYPIYGIILLLVSAGVLNTILMSVLERKRELGILLGLGMRPGSLLLMVMLETAFLGALGLLGGLAVGLGVHSWFAVYGLDLSSFFSGGFELAGTVVDPILYSQLRPGRLWAVAVVVMGLTLTMGAYPAWRASRVDPVEAIEKP